MMTATKIDSINGINAATQLWGINVDTHKTEDNTSHVDTPQSVIIGNKQFILSGIHKGIKFADYYDAAETIIKRQELAETIGKLGADFISGIDYEHYSLPNGRTISLQHEINRIAIRATDRALNPPSRGKTESQLSPHKIGKGGKTTLNVSSGKIAGLQNASWCKRSQKGRHVPRHDIIEAAHHVSHELWSYCLECISEVRAFAIGFDIKTRKPSVWAYHFKIDKIVRWIYPEDNFTSRILWAGASLAVSEHRSKGRDSNKNRTTYIDFEPEDIVGSVVKNLGELNIPEFVKGLYPKPIIRKEYDEKEKTRLRTIAREMEAKRVQAISDLEDIKNAYLGNMTERDMSENQLEFMKKLEQWRIKNNPDKEFFYPDNITHNSPQGLVYTVSDDILRDMCDVPLYGPHTLKKLREYGKAKQVRDSFLVYSSREWSQGAYREKLNILMRTARIKALMNDILAQKSLDPLPKLGRPENVNFACLITRATPARFMPDEELGPSALGFIPQNSLNYLRHCAAFCPDSWDLETKN